MLNPQLPGVHLSSPGGKCAFTRPERRGVSTPRAIPHFLRMDVHRYRSKQCWRRCFPVFSEGMHRAPPRSEIDLGQWTIGYKY